MPIPGYQNSDYVMKGVFKLEDEQWKKEIFKKAQTMGIINDPQWLNRLDEPMPAWAVLEVVLKLIDIVDPPSKSYD
jgi:hypothetical protein